MRSDCCRNLTRREDVIGNWLRPGEERDKRRDKCSWYALVVQLQRVGDGDLQLGVVVLSFAVQVDPDAGHGKGVS